MQTSNYVNGRGGHCPGRVRDTFLSALEAFADWSEGEPEPTISHEVSYEPVEISISDAAKMVWNCTDVLPGHAWDLVEASGLDQTARRRTYASVARAMKRAIN